MRIYIFMKDVSLTGGTERVTVNLSSLFYQKGHDVTIVSYYHGKKSMTYKPLEGVRVIYLLENSCPDSGKVFVRGKLFIRALKVLKAFLKTENITNDDIIVSQNFFSNALMWLAGNAKNTIGCEHFKYDLYSKVARGIRCYIYSHLKCIVTLTEKDRQRYIKYISSERTATIANMVIAKDDVSPNMDSKNIIAIGRLTPQKGFDMLIDAMDIVVKKYPDWKLNIFGEGDKKEELQEQIYATKLEKNVCLCGYTSNLDDEFCKSAFFVLSSRFEGFPLVLIEALGQGFPSVAFDCPEGPAQLLEHGGGILVEKENVLKLAEGMIYMIEHPEFRAKCMSHKEYIKGHLSPDVIYGEWLHLFNRLNN